MARVRRAVILLSNAGCVSVWRSPQLVHSKRRRSQMSVTFWVPRARSLTLTRRVSCTLEVLKLHHGQRTTERRSRTTTSSRSGRSIMTSMTRMRYRCRRTDIESGTEPLLSSVCFVTAECGGAPFVSDGFHPVRSDGHPTFSRGLRFPIYCRRLERGLESANPSPPPPFHPWKGSASPGGELALGFSRPLIKGVPTIRESNFENGSPENPIPSIVLR
ncbi:hypothetical protein BH20ACT22_BH20ACT22_25160 [soil metagenome]